MAENNAIIIQLKKVINNMIYKYKADIDLGIPPLECDPVRINEFPHSSMDIDYYIESVGDILVPMRDTIHISFEHDGEHIIINTSLADKFDKVLVPEKEFFDNFVKTIKDEVMNINENSYILSLVDSSIKKMKNELLKDKFIPDKQYDLMLLSRDGQVVLKQEVVFRAIQNKELSFSGHKYYIELSNEINATDTFIDNSFVIMRSKESDVLWKAYSLKRSHITFNGDIKNCLFFLKISKVREKDDIDKYTEEFKRLSSINKEIKDNITKDEYEIEW